MSTRRPFVTITEQPAAKLSRFRYLSEARSVGSIPGVNSSPDRKTYPTIRVHGHKGPFLVLLSLLNPTDNLVHPHTIKGSDPRYQCRQGVIYVITEGPDVVFKNIYILCVKGKTETDVKTALKNRQHLNIDPFKAGFQHISDHSLIDFTAVRLCFQVFLPGPDWTPADLKDPQKYTWPLAPVASEVVYDAKKLNDLKITYINGCAGPLTGGHEMTLLCEKYTGQNPDVVFEDEHGWMRTASVELYHKHLAILFKTPPYRKDIDPNCADAADGYKVKVYLQQSTERGIQRSQPVTLQYLPNDLKGSSLKFPIAPPSSQAQGQSPSSGQVSVKYEDTRNSGLDPIPINNSNDKIISSSNENSLQSSSFHSTKLSEPLSPIYDIDLPMSSLSTTNSQNSGELWDCQEIINCILMQFPNDSNQIDSTSTTTSLNTSKILSDVLTMESEVVTRMKALST